jgi:hypothetical protein
MNATTGWLFFWLLAPAAAMSQQTPTSAQSSVVPAHLTGKVRLQSSNEILAGVTVSNRGLGQHNISDMGGNYRIVARPGDTLVFTSAGYLNDTLLISQDMLAADYTVYLNEKVVALPAVKVTETNTYELDSLQRHEDYAWLLDKKHPVKLMNEKRPGDDPGLSFSPIGYYSKGEVAKRRLKRRLKQEEEDYYVDFKFPRAKVSLLTGLRGDSLDMFMIRFRPSYQWCRTANTMDILLYINDHLVLFRKGSSSRELKEERWLVGQHFRRENLQTIAANHTSQHLVDNSFHTKTE